MRRRVRFPLAMYLMVFVAGCAAAQPSGGTVPQTLEPRVATPALSSAVATLGKPAPGLKTFNLVPDQSEARFLIDEILAGSPKTVVGSTSAVSGQIRGDFADPASVEVGPVQVDMSTLKTDNNFRNRALHDAILQTGSEANRYAELVVTRIEGLPTEVTLGTAYPLSLVGDLTIHGATRAVTFDATVTPVSDTRLEGSASASMPYSDFGISILRLPPQVASVGDVVTLQIDFVAEAR